MELNSTREAVKRHLRSTFISIIIDIFKKRIILMPSKEKQIVICYPANTVNSNLSIFLLGKDLINHTLNFLKDHN